MSPEPKPRSDRATVTPVPLKLLAAVGALLVVPGGAFLVAANIGTGGKVAIGVAVTWWLVASAVIGRTALRRRPDLRTPVRATLAAAAVVSIVGFFVLTRDEEVGERIATGSDPAAASAQEPGARAPSGERRPDRAEPKRNVQTLAGGFSGASGHSGTGKAAVVKLAEGGRVLTFSEFDVDMGGGELLIYLTRGEPGSDAEVKDFEDLGPLKGNVGDQQYQLPPNIDLARYSTVVIWCVPFSTRIAQAPLS